MVSSKKQTNNLHLHKVTGCIDDSFVGIKIKNNRIDFYYPEAYNLANEKDINTFRRDFLSIINTISIAKTLSEDRAKIETTLSGEDSFAMHSYLWIIKDFLLNGFYVNREKILKRNQRGRINWKRTIQTQPIVSKGNIIYTDIIVEVPNQTDNIIVEIHKYCVKKSIEIVGWLFGLTPNLVENNGFNNSKKKQYVAILQTEISVTFDDKKKERLNHMLKVIQGVNGATDSDEFVYGVDSYYYIFERMIDHIFGNVENISDFNPRSNWYLKQNRFEKTPSSELRPDTILLDKESKTAYILDSKYYRFGITGVSSDLPESTSIQKQITYGEYVQQNHSHEQIENIRSAFILPYNKKSNKWGFNNNLEYIGFSKADWKDNQETHQLIYAFLIDLKHVITTWNLTSSHIDDIDILTTLIENAVIESQQIPKND